MQKFFEFMEAREKTVVFTFGRFNPPTTGHEKLIKKVADVATKYSADFFIYPSHSQSPKKDPLPHVKKVAYMRKMFPKYASKIVASGADKTAINVATSLYDKGYTNCIMVVGSDRVKEFNDLLSKYNGVKARHGYYKFDKFEVVSAGERDPDAEGVTGMSASKMRAAAASNDFDSFKKGLPKGFTDEKSLFDDVRKFMGVQESFLETPKFVSDDEKLRDDYVEGLIFNVGDLVEDVNTGAYGKVVRRGTNYLVFAESDGTIHKNWLFELKEIRRVKQDKDVEDKKGTQPAKYYAKDADGDEMSKSTKAARARHFAKGAKSDDDDPRSYKPAPGDKGAKTKPSKHTLKYKKMFGEEELKYPKVKETKKGRQYIDGDYKTFESPDPPKPDSSEMMKEMRAVKRKTDNRDLKTERSVINHDDDVAYAIKEYMDKNNLEYSKEDIKKISSAGEVVSRFYKNKHQHPRPEQIVEKMEMNIDIMKKPSDSMNTPAYPSGHSLQSRLVAEYYAKQYPKHKNGLIEAAEECGEGRIAAGWHYPSDHKHGVQLAKETAKMINLNPNQIESFIIETNIYRVGSEKYFEYFRDYRKSFQNDTLHRLSDYDIELLESDIGEFDMYKGEHVPLDCPMMNIQEEEKVELNKPKRGGPKKYYVYVKDPKTGNVKKVTWGDTTGLKVKLNDLKARKSFAARHRCEQQTDKTKAAYWACRLPRYAKQLGLSGGGNFFW